MASNGDAVRPKRKQSPVSLLDRPAKQLRPDLQAPTPGDLTPLNGSLYNVEGNKEIAATAALNSLSAPDSPEWQATIEKAVRSVVSIHFCQTCSFDADLSTCGQATGFIVDAERGYIMTNRHVVSAGPFWGYCIFDNHEECDVVPVYRDPVHDFGILKFNTKAIKHMKISALDLSPDGAKVGAEIRVVGNDAGEKLSILSGVISRLDRNAPEYDGGYNDFNTNYIQASAAASGGSSGSPVINLAGNVVALQAGGRTDNATTDYFLPLDRPLRALKCMQEGQVITRGTIQTQWVLKPYDECRRLGLTPEWEAKIRAAAPKETTNILAAEVVLPEGPGDDKIKEGDVLIKVNGEFLTSFIKLGAILDSSVGGTITLLMQRGGKDHEVTLNVGDLHSITPDRFLTVGGSTFHDLSYQLARIHAVAVKGVYVCESAGSFKLDGCISGWIVESVDNRPTPDLDAFIRVMESIADKSRVVVSYHHLSDLHTRGTSIVYIDRHWHPKMRLAVRNDETGLWDFSDIGKAKPADAPVARSADFIELDGVSHPAAAEIVRSFVRVSCSMPCKLDGFPQARKTGFGLVVDAEKGLVLLSRAIVPYDLCDISITVADSIIVEGEVVFLHPIQNWVIVKYDPKLVQAPVQSAPLSEKMPKLGEDIIFVGFNHNWRLVMAKTTVTDITAVTIPVNMSAPRYRAINVDSITVDTGLAGQCSNGVLIGGDGKVQGLWLNYLGERSRSSKDIEYHLGLPVPAFMPVLDKILKGETPELRILNMESYVIHMSQARIMGVSESWIKKVCEANKGRHQLFMVRKIDCPAIGSTASEENLQEGDIILTLNGQLITRVSEFDIMYDQPSLEVLIVRKGQEKTLRVPTTPTAHIQTARALIFCGAVLHAPHHAVRQQISKLHSEIYVAARSRGSPAAQYGLGPTNFITAVNGVETHTLDDFVREVGKIPDNTYFRLRAVTFENVPWVVTMKKNDHYFPMSEYVKTSAVTGSKWKVVSYADRKPTDDKDENAHPDAPIAENMDEEPARHDSAGEEQPAADATMVDPAVDGVEGDGIAA